MESKKCKLIILGCLILFGILFIAIKINGLMNGIRTDWEVYFVRNKSFFQEQSFSGKIVNKSFLEKSSRPYSLIVKLDSTTVIPEGIGAYYDFYVFNSEERMLQFVVSEEVYKDANMSFSIVKKEFSDSIYINDRSYLLISKERFKWLP